MNTVIIAQMALLLNNNIFSYFSQIFFTDHSISKRQDDVIYCVYTFASTFKEIVKICEIQSTSLIMTRKRACPFTVLHAKSEKTLVKWICDLQCEGVPIFCRML